MISKLVTFFFTLKYKKRGYVWKVITDESEMRNFLQAYLEYARVSPPAERREFYIKEVFKKGEVHGLYLNHKLVGGFALNPLLASLWYNTIIKEDEKYIVKDAQKYFDLNFVFSNPFCAAYVWLKVSEVIGAKNDIKIIWNCDVKKTGLAELYNSISEGFLYNYYFKVNDTNFSVLWSSPKKFRRLPLIYFSRLWRRIK